MKWTLPDIVDLEYFLEQDQEAQGEDFFKKEIDSFIWIGFDGIWMMLFPMIYYLKRMAPWQGRPF